MPSTCASSPVSVPAISVRDLTLRFGGVTALDSLSLDVGAGQVIGVIGPNGAGKTSLLNCICGGYRASSGSIRISGGDVTRHSPWQIAAQGVARTFQTVQLIPEASVLDNALVGRHRHSQRGILAACVPVRSVRRRRRQEIEIVETILARLGLEQLAHQPVHQLAFGQQRLVEIARALASEPTIICLDEPTSGMNSSERAEIGKVIRAVRDQAGVTQVLVEHDVHFIRKTCDYIFVLNFGALLAEGEPSEVLADQRVIEAYVGQPK